MKLFRWHEKRADEAEPEEENILNEDSIENDVLLRSWLDDGKITKRQALQIPTVRRCINLISDIVADCEIKLYKRENDNIIEQHDRRCFLLNKDTGDTLDGMQFKKALMIDALLGKGGYAYIHKTRGEIRSIHYVEEEYISFNYKNDPIFKDYDILVNGKAYLPHQFITLLNETRNGYKSSRICETSNRILSVAYNTIKFEENLVKTGGNKKGFLETTKKLSADAMTVLKKAFKNLYSNNSENIIVLNDGLTFKEASNTSVEMQLDESKQTNSKEVCKLFNVPTAIIEGNATEADRERFVQECIIPWLEKFACAINRVLLKESEKDSYFFAFDTNDLTKGDIEKRYKAYEIASKNGFMQTDEIRQKENLPKLGIKFIKLGLQDVLLDPATGNIYTPNTDKTSNISEPETNIKNMTAEGGENGEN